MKIKNVSDTITEKKGIVLPHQKELKYYTRKEVCKRLGISIVTLSNYIKNGIISCYRIGKNIRITEAQIQDALIEINNKKTA